MELERLNGEMTRFLGMAAQYLRTPLGAITAYADFLEQGAGPMLNAEQREFLSTIQESSRFMLHLIYDLLDLSTIESGNLTLEREPPDLLPLVMRSVVLNRTLASRKSIAIHLHVDVAAPELSLDQPKIEQVLNNLIGNPIKFSPPGQSVTVSPGRQGEDALIAIADNGPGIPASELQEISVAFQKGSVRPTAGETSTVLGLAICRQIVECHVGRIRVESRIGLGSTFHVALYASKGRLHAVLISLSIRPGRRAYKRSYAACRALGYRR